MIKNMARSQKYGNNTLDVLNKGCLDFYDTIACGRVGIIVIISGITCLFILLKIIKYHVNKHSQVHHYVIFYVSIIECFSCGANSMFGVRYPQLEFSTNFLKLLQFILICHYYWSLITRSRHRDDILQHVVNPVLCLYMLYCTTVVLMGMVDISGTWNECLRPYWLMLSIADLIAVQLFGIVGLYVTHYSYHKHHNNHANRKNQINSNSRDIWLVTGVYQLSAILSVLYDGLMSFIGNNDAGCSFIFNYKQIYYSIILLLFLIFKFFLPTWILLVIFKPIRVKSRPSEVALTSHYNNNDNCNFYRKIFFNNDDCVEGNLQNSSINNFTIDQSSTYGSFADFSCTDSSSSDLSPTIAHYWAGVGDNNCFNKYEKHFTGSSNCDDKGKSIDDDKFDNNLQYCCDNYEKKDDFKKKHLTTINEESGNMMMENLYD